MKAGFSKRLVALLLVSLFAVTILASCSKGSDNPSNSPTPGNQDPNKPATWIADRTITIQAFVDDIGSTLPKDINDTDVMKEFTKRTGIKLDIRYTPGDSDSAILASQLAAGTIPDVIVSYLNNSSRPEFPLLLKAAKEGMFADLMPFIKESQVYKNYLQDDYLPNDTKKNITFRDDLDGAAYIMHLAIPAVDRSTEWNPQNEYIGGMYIQKAIVDSLGIDPSQIRTQEEFYDLLVKIKNGGFKDDNGNPVYPLGPKYWGGSVDALDFVLREYNWGVSDGYNITENGEVLHEAETDYVFEKINYVRKLIKEGLMNPEFFTMDSTRADEVSRTKNSAIIGDVHNYKDIIYKTDDWVPLGPLNDFTGDNSNITSGKGGYGAWAISADAKNPEEIFKFFDYMATKEGQLLAEYGIEGQDYNMVDGKPVVTETTLQAINDGDTEYMIEKVGAGFGGSGNYFFDFMLTNVDFFHDFGESRPGAGSSTTFAKSVEIAAEYPRTIKKVPGLSATAYLSAEEMQAVKPLIDQLNYKEMLVSAMFAPNDNEVKNIVESFRTQLKASGVDEFKAYIKDMYEKDPASVDFRTK